MKIITSKNYRKMKEVEFKGTLKKTKDNFIYLDVSNNIINGLFSNIDEENIKKPPYNIKSFNNVGAHISVISSDEYKDNNIEDIKEIGQEFNFRFKDIKATNPDGWDEVKEVYFMEVKSKELENLRQKYKLSKLLEKHQFHITIAIKKE